MNFSPMQLRRWNGTRWEQFSGVLDATSGLDFELERIRSC